MPCGSTEHKDGQAEGRGVGAPMPRVHPRWSGCSGRLPVLPAHPSLAPQQPAAALPPTPSTHCCSAVRWIETPTHPEGLRHDGEAAPGLLFHVGGVGAHGGEGKDGAALLVCCVLHHRTRGEAFQLAAPLSGQHAKPARHTATRGFARWIGGPAGHASCDHKGGERPAACWLPTRGGQHLQTHGTTCGTAHIRHLLIEQVVPGVLTPKILRKTSTDRTGT